MDNQAEQTIYKWVETPTDWYVYGIRTVRVADTTLLIPLDDGKAVFLTGLPDRP
jgi:hypothetical protein